MLKTFTESESGAVTVDWVVLTAALCGLGVATAAVVTAGVEDLSRDTNDVMTGYQIVTRFFEDVQLAANDFAGGAIGDWLGGTAYDAGGALGEVLAVGPGGMAELNFNMPEGATQAVLTFDLIGGDSIDPGETASIMINGQPVTVASGTWGDMAFADQGVSGVTVETTTVATNQQLGGDLSDNRLDSVTTVSITVDNPGQNVTLGISSATNQDIGDEYYGIDNVDISAS